MYGPKKAGGRLIGSFLGAVLILASVTGQSRADVTPGDIYGLDCQTWLADGRAAMGPQEKKANDSITRYLLSVGFALGHFQAQTGDRDLGPEGMRKLGQALIAACKKAPQMRFMEAVRGVSANP